MKSYILSIQNITRLLTLIVLFTFSFAGKAQQFKPNTEVGVLLGASYYLGDLNTTHFQNALLGGGLIVRKNIDRRFSYKAELLYLNVKADDLDNPTDTIALSRGLRFQSPIYELSGQIEFNFLPYDPGNPLYTWTPFIYTGVSFFNFNPKAENKDGLLVDLQPLGTEGQGTTSFPEREEYSLTQFSIPLGGGVKIAVNPSFNIIFEYGIRKTFTDYLDDVSTTYPGNSTLINNASAEMSNPVWRDPENIIQRDVAQAGLNAPATYQRGDPNKKDWYSFLGITLSFKLNDNTQGCDY
jgi:hypothetical protein